MARPMLPFIGSRREMSWWMVADSESSSFIVSVSTQKSKLRRGTGRSTSVSSSGEVVLAVRCTGGNATARSVVAASWGGGSDTVLGEGRRWGLVSSAIWARMPIWAGAKVGQGTP
jgi:hypothetical protein